MGSVRFTKPFWDGIADGSITVAYRGWKKPTVVVGRPYRTGGGRVEVLSVEVIEPGSISTKDAKKAGYRSVDEVLAQINTDEGRRLHRVEFRKLDEPDPRSELANRDNLSDDDVTNIRTRLERLDNASRSGPWTARTLELIAANPGRRAPDLAEMVGRETKPFKLDVRKLKNLGLTISLRIGYELSPRGMAFRDRTGAS